tara:strand:- start:1008 stop:2309 length:1302 start_codon:yes stop_codon:yes gene_type:complete
MPTIYDKKLVVADIKDQILERYDINIKFNEKLNYSLLPKPHFYSKNVTILNLDRDIANVENLKIFISIDRLFKINYTSIKDIILKNAEFNVIKDDLGFFKKLLFVSPTEYKLTIKKSNLFFKDNEDEVLFLNKINECNVIYDHQKLHNSINCKNELFNLPFRFTANNNFEKKELSLKFNLKKLRLVIENFTNYAEKIKKGYLDILFVSKNTKLDYQIKKNSLDFNSKDKINNYKGFVDFKPFYFSSDFILENLNFRNLLSDDSILINIIQSEIFNNENLNISARFKIREVTDVKEINKLDLEVSLSEGNINLSNSKFMWKDDLEIGLNESLLIYDKNQISLVTRVNIDIIDLDDFYSSFQIPKKNRKKIKKIEFDFNYNITEKKINFDNVNIDKASDIKLEKFIDKFNSKQSRIFNIITYKNFVNGFFEAYAG